MFVDEVTITVIAGKGGNGVVTFRHEKYVPRGGPSGGSGGRGGDVYIVSSRQIDDLSHLADNPSQRAEDGKPGGSSNKYGASGRDLFISVPVGVTVSLDNESETFLADLVEDGQEFLVAKGGRGGLGNANFANSRRQTPHIAYAGESGEKLKIRIRLKMLADVGLVGMPNAGKSTLLNAMSRANAKVGDYQFTTLQPQLGVVETTNWQRYTVADIPGLIEGASVGRGLGIAFLKHIERCRVLLYLIDLTGEDPNKTLLMLWNEVKLYSEETFAKPALIVGNKIDIGGGLNSRSLEDFAKGRGIPYMAISAKERLGVTELKEKLYEMILVTPMPQTRVATELMLIKKDERTEVTFDGDVWIAKNSRLERLIACTDIETVDGQAFLERQMRRLGIEDKLRKQGAKDGDTVMIGGKRFVIG